MGSERESNHDKDISKLKPKAERFCPKCQSSEIYFHRTFTDTDKHTTEYKCHSCEMIWAEHEELEDFDSVYDNYHDPDPCPYDEQDPADDSEFNIPDKPNPYCDDKQTKILFDDDDNDDKDRPVLPDPFPVP